MPDARALVATPYRRGVLVLAIVTLCWRAWTVSRWTWHKDDWGFVEQSASAPLLDYLFQDHNGHVMPGGLLVTKLATLLAPLDFSAVVVLVALAGAATVLVWGRAFERLTQGNLVALLPLSVLALSPVLLEPMMWWACAVNALPLQLSLGWMVIAAADWVEHRRRADLVRFAIAYTLGLLFWHKALLLVLPAVVTVVALSPGPFRERVRTAIRPTALLLAISVPYLALFRYLTQRTQTAYDLEPSFAGHTVAGSLRQYAEGFSDMFLPAVLGGPWGSMQVDPDPLSTPSAATTWSVLAVCAVALGWLVLRHRAALWLLLLPLGYTVVALGIVLFSTRADDVWDVMTLTRYYVDSIMVAALAAALMIRESQRRRTRSASAPRWLLPAAALALGASLVSANVVAADRMGVHPGRAWVGAFRSDATHLAESHSSGSPAVVWDGFAPDVVLQPGYWPEEARLSAMLQPFGASITTGVATDQLYVAEPSGHLVPAGVDPIITSEPGPVDDCGYYLEPGDSVQVEMTGELYYWGWGLQVAGFTSTGTALVIDLGDDEVDVALPSGLQERAVQVEGAVAPAVTIRLPADAAGNVCVSALSVGTVAPNP
ncbi:hypothetical protein [Nocardioides currus]|uniref:Glycosyltransferase RgtA/B/C/D-like domain-containing protein n=1 Tax=Nocardioides currus TaxID=2133958 RepID=A0A2R7YRR0_9ACTN|nr:hypothetical protein [Nocardioides currus]PUA79097.1 hypothetical protein C7S10_20335 [Nocardioides currus]